MLLQSDKTLPPPGGQPDFESLAAQASKDSVPNQWIDIPARRVNVGMNDPENADGPARYFGWDNEKPSRTIQVHAFQAKARPLTNEDFARFLEQHEGFKVPASWFVETEEAPEAERLLSSAASRSYVNGSSVPVSDIFLQGKSVRTVYGLVPLRFALHWPVVASYDELSGCATWMNGRIPTAEEVRSIYSYAEVNKSKEIDSILTRKISAVNGYGVFQPGLRFMLTSEKVIYPMKESRSRPHPTLG